MVDPEVLTQLFNAAVNDRVEELEELISNNGVDINVCQKDGSTLLMMAAQCCALKCAQKLIERGADVNACIEDWTALMCACDNSDDAIAVALVNAGAIFNFPPTRQEETTKEKESWLHIFLTDNGAPTETARICAQRLLQQGFFTPRVLARAPFNMFDANFLNSIGIVGKGLQLLLIGLHAELHALHKNGQAQQLWTKHLDD
eukprot:gene9011-10640_t